MSAMDEDQQKAYDITTKAIDGLYDFGDRLIDQARLAGLTPLEKAQWLKGMGSIKGHGFDGVSLTLSDNRPATLAGIVAGKAAGWGMASLVSYAGLGALALVANPPGIAVVGITALAVGLGAWADYYIGGLTEKFVENHISDEQVEEIFSAVYTAIETENQRFWNDIGESADFFGNVGDAVAMKFEELATNIEQAIQAELQRIGGEIAQLASDSLAGAFDHGRAALAAVLSDDTPDGDDGDICDPLTVLEQLLADPATAIDRAFALFGEAGGTPSSIIGTHVASASGTFVSSQTFAVFPRDPLVIDLDGDGVELTPLAGSTTMFDTDGDGFAQRTAWVGPDDGLLVRDIDGDGRITQAAEVFGGGTGEATGFAVLAMLDGNGDGAITAADAAFASLRVWRDANGNGAADAGEMMSLDQAGITRIGVVATAVNQTVNGNRISATATVTLAGGATRTLAEAWLVSDQTTTTARPPEDSRPLYQVRVKPLATTIDIDGHPTAITPGMAVTVEIKTGRRRVIDYTCGAVL